MLNLIPFVTEVRGHKSCSAKEIFLVIICTVNTNRRIKKLAIFKLIQCSNYILLDLIEITLIVVLVTYLNLSSIFPH